MGKEDALAASAGGNIKSSLGVNRAFSTRTPQAAVAPAQAADGRRAGTVRSQDTAVINLDRIIADPDQPRKEFEPESLERLAASLKARGQLQPIRVRWDEGRGLYVILMGERRWRAAEMAGLTSLTCVVHEGLLSDGEKLELQLIENAVREDLKPVEQARAFQALMERNGWDGKTLAATLQVTPATVSRALTLLDLPEAVQDKVEQGALPASTAYEIAQLPDPAERTELADLAVAEKLTKTDVREAVKAIKARKAPATKRPDPVTFDTGDCTVTVKWKRAGGQDATAALRNALAQARQAKDSAA
jgi:ParB family chromosome partitioning protein